jgi:hypothetical protein
MTPAVLDGFTLRNGSGTTWYGGSQRNGGGLFALYTSAVISNNIIRDNTATVYGGGLIVSGWGVVIAGNTVANNKLTTPTPDVNSVGGGGMHVSGDGTIVRDNTVTGNEAGNAGGILLYNGTMTVTGNVISGNRAFTSAQGGGGVSAYYVKSTLLSGNVIRNNTAAGSGGGVRLTTPANLIIRNSLISGNSAANGGGVYQGVSVNVSISSSTVTGNIATGEGGGLYLTSAPIRDTIIAFNSSGVYTGSAASFSYNYVFGNTAYNYKGIPDMTGSLGNLMQDPQFEDAAAGDYHLQPTSPLIDAGTDIRDTPSERDLDGNLRKLGPRVDIGAYEFVPAGVFTLEDARRALALAAGFVVAEAGDARLNLVAPEAPAIDLLDAIRIARKAVGTDTNP